MIEQARENLGVADAVPTTLADTGYGAGADLQATQEKPLPVLAPTKDASAHDQPYASQHFAYDAQAHSVTCPQGRLLDHEGHTTKTGRRVERYRCHHRDCPVRALCTRDPKGRQIEIWPHAPVVQAMRALSLPATQPDRRAALWATQATRRLSALDGVGLAAVRTQWSLLCTTLN